MAPDEAPTAAVLVGEVTTDRPLAGERNDGPDPDVEALIPEKGKALAVFGSKVRVDELLERVVQAARAKLPEQPDMTKAKDREAVRGAAAFVASSKSGLEKTGLELGADMRAALAKVKDERKRIADYLTEQQAEIRAPLTAWEQRKKALAEQLVVRVDWLDATSLEIADEIRRIQAVALDATQDKAEVELQNDALAKLRKSWGAADKRERDAADLERLRAAEAARIAAAEAERKRVEELEALEKSRQAAAEERQRIADEAAEKARAEEAEKLKAADAARLAALDRRMNEAFRITAPGHGVAEYEADLRRIEAIEIDDSWQERQERAAECKAQTIEALGRSLYDAMVRAKEADAASAAQREKDKAEAVEAERQRQADERRRQEEADAKAAANKSRQARNRAAIAAAVQKVLDMDDAKKRPPAERLADALMTAGVIPNLEYRP